MNVLSKQVGRIVVEAFLGEQAALVSNSAGGEILRLRNAEEMHDLRYALDRALSAIERQRRVQAL